MATPTQPSAPIPAEIGPYRVDERIGQGGMGEVYRGYDARLDRPVALKRVKTDMEDPDAARERFRREARALARVRHPAVVEVYDWIEGDDGDWIVMELLEGRSLSSLIVEGPLEMRRAVEVARDVASGLAAVHAHGIVHRDLKPDNVMWMQPAGRIKILDFGLAKRVDSMDGLTLTETISREGQILGTVRFMSPEQAAGREVDPRSDLFSLGVLLYEMLTGVSPFRGDNAVETLTRICTVAETPVHQLDPAVPEAVSELVRRMLKKEPERRLQSAVEVADVLAALAAGLGDGRSTTELLAALPVSGSDSDVSSVTRVAAGTAYGQMTTLSETPALSGSHVRTLLLNDLVDSTKLVEKLGDERAAQIFEQHDRMARDLLKRNSGREIDKSDGFLMLFERPIDAVRFALGYHAALDEISDQEEVTVSSRVGIHVGEVVLRVNSAEDVARGAKPLEVEGLAKAMAARFMTLAGARQTLISRGVFDLAKRSAVGAEDLPEGLRWAEHGRYRMKGVEEPVAVFEVGVEGASPLAPPADTKKVTRVVEVSGRLSGWRLKAAAAAVLLMLALAGLGVRQLWLLREVPPPVYVAVPPTEVVAEAPDDFRLEASVIQAGLIRELQGYVGVAPVEPAGRNAEIDSPQILALAMGADEVLLSKLECSGGTCQVVLKRVEGTDESVAWNHRFIDPTRNLLDLTILAGEQVRGGYLDFEVRDGVSELSVLPEDYEEYWRVYRRFLSRESGTDLDSILVGLQQLRETSPRFLQAYLLEVKILRQRFVATRAAEDLETAIEVCDQALEIAPNQPQALRALARAQIEVGRLDEAENSLAGIARIEPGDAVLYALRAALLERRGESEEALSLMRQSVERMRSSVQLMNLADMENRLGEVDTARASLEASLELDPENFDAHSRLALVEIVHGSVERAAELYERLVEQAPEYAELTNLGVAYLLLQRYTAAVQVFERALEDAPGSPPSLLNLADANLLLGEEEIAQGLYQETLDALLEDPDPEALLIGKAQALAQLGRHQEAIAAIQEALRLQPDNPQVIYGASLVYVIVGERTSGLLHARRALELGVEKRWFEFAWFDPIRAELES